MRFEEAHEGWSAGRLTQYSNPSQLDDDSVRYKPRPVVARKVDAFRGIVEMRLSEYLRLSAVRLFDEVKAAGYDGGYTQLKEFVRQVRPTPPVDPVVRFETAPGHQAQVDFAEFRLPWGKRYALVVVLGYSRLLWLQFFRRQTMAVLMRGLEEAFEFFGGVASGLLFDQLKAVIIDDERLDGGRLLENAEFLRFAAHWGFRIRACRPYRARTKGKVERPISYVRQSFSYGRSFLNDDGLNAQALSWMARTANVRLLGAQISLRNNRRLQAAMRSSRLPAIKTLEAFDFSFQPSIKREQIERLHEFGFIERKESVVFLGPPGVGKTHHLAISAYSGRS